MMIAIVSTSRIVLNCNVVELYEIVTVARKEGKEERR